MATLRTIESKSPIHAGLVQGMRLIQRELGVMSDKVLKEDFVGVIQSAEYIARLTETIKNHSNCLKG